MAKYETREQWLDVAVSLLVGLFPQFTPTMFKTIRVACGWPRQKRGRGANGSDTVGQYWPASTTSDGVPQIFISPRLAAVEALETLLHEMVHHEAGASAGHKGAFARLAAEVGLLPPWPSTTATEATRKTLAEALAYLGEYPHGTITPKVEPKKQGSRLRLWECDCAPKPVKIRCASDSLQALCLVCGCEFHKVETEAGE